MKGNTVKHSSEFNQPGMTLLAEIHSLPCSTPQALEPLSATHRTEEPHCGCLVRSLPNSIASVRIWPAEPWWIPNCNRLLNWCQNFWKNGMPLW